MAAGPSKSKPGTCIPTWAKRPEKRCEGVDAGPRALLAKLCSVRRLSVAGAPLLAFDGGATAVQLWHDVYGVFGRRGLGAGR